MAVSKIILSGSAHGLGINITGTTSGTAATLHTAISGTGASLDEVWIYGSNAGTTDSVLNLMFGSGLNPRDHIIFTVPAKDGMYLIAPGFPLRNGAIVKGYADGASKIQIRGYVHRVT